MQQVETRGRALSTFSHCHAQSSSAFSQSHVRSLSDRSIQRKKARRQLDSSCCSSNCSESLGDVVLDLLRGKVFQCLEQKQQKNFRYNSSNGTETNNSCSCKFLIILDIVNNPQYWVVQIKGTERKHTSLIDSQKNYLNCIDSLELYSSIQDVCCSTNRKILLSNKNWFFFEMLIRINVSNGVDILLEDFAQCLTCTECVTCTEKVNS